MAIFTRFTDAISRKFPKWRKKTSNSSSFPQVMWVDTSTLTDDLFDELDDRMGLAHKLLTRLTSDRFDKWFEISTDNDQLKKQMEILNSKEGLNIRQIYKKTTRFAMKYGYSFIFLGYIDSGDSFEDPVQNPRSIEYLRIVTEKDIREILLDEDPVSPTFGDIIGYKLRNDSFVTGNDEMTVHASRTIHVPNDDTETPNGRSFFLPSYNYLNTFDNVVWSIGQAYFRYGGGFPHLQIEGWDNMDKKLKDQYAAQFANLTTEIGFITDKKGFDFEFKGTQGRALDPEKFFDTTLKAVAIATDLPYALIAGVNAGEVTGSETNLKDYYSQISSLQTLVDEPILRELYRKLQETNQIPKGEYEMLWNPLFENTEKEIAEVQKLNAESREIMLRTGVITKQVQLQIDNGDLIVQEKEESEPEEEDPNNPNQLPNGQLDIKKKTDQRLISKFSMPKFVRLETLYSRELKKILKIMETSVIQVVKGFFNDSIKNDIIKPQDFKKITNSLDKVFTLNKKSFNKVVNDNINNAFNQGFKSGETGLGIAVKASISKKNQLTTVIQTEHLDVVNNIADDILKDINVQIGIQALNPVTKFAAIEELIKETFSKKLGRLDMGVGNEINSALNQGNLLAGKESGIVVGKEWISIIDGVTTDTCIGLNGEIVAIGEPFSTGDFAPPAQSPPHPCRSSIELLTSEDIKSRGLDL